MYFRVYSTHTHGLWSGVDFGNSDILAGSMYIGYIFQVVMNRVVGSNSTKQFVYTNVSKYYINLQ